jgi:cytochrome c biogenesis protein CcmG, thiol:disulfide interchange protein DsbE
MKRFLIPLGLFGVLVVFLAIGLTRDPHEVPSPLVGGPAPQFQLPQLASMEGKTFSPKDMLGKVWLLNIWATWCESCRGEHPVLVELSKQIDVPIIGFNYKEVRGDGGLDMKDIPPGMEKKLAFQRASQLLAQLGNPYQLTVMDLDGQVAIDYGVYGVPETYLIDKAGVIRYKQIGPITPEALEKKILPLVKELQK